MPIYEYRCRACRKRVSIFQRSITAAAAAVCDGCGSKDLTRLVSKFAVVRSEEDYSDDMADDQDLMDFDESDPKAMARWARKMKDEMGEEGGPEFDEMIDRLEAGEDMESIMGEAGEMDAAGVPEEF